jgi:hypothetical protein
MLHGGRAWAGKSETAIGRAVDRGERPPMSAAGAPELRRLAQDCWAQVAADRPSFAEVVARLRPPERELLIFVCSPSISPLSNALPEALAVDAACWQGGGVCEIVAQDTTAQQLRAKLVAQSTRRLLFIGHADADDPAGAGHTLGFTAAGGGLETVNAQDVASVLGNVGTGNGGALDLCFLNGCCSEALGRAARDRGVATVVCWSTRALDSAARLFSTTFFETIHLHRSSCRQAFDEAVRAVRVETLASAVSAGRGYPNGAAAGTPLYEIRGPAAGPKLQPWAAGDPVLIDAAGEHRGSDVL